MTVAIACTGMAPRLAPRMAADPDLDVVCVGDLDEVAERERIEAVVGYQFQPGSLRDLPALRWLHLTGTGSDHLAAAGLAPGVTVTSSARVPAEAVAEYALSGLLLMVKDLVGVAAGHQRPWLTSEATLLRGSHVGVLGAGRIGSAVLTKVAALGAHTVAITRRPDAQVPHDARVVTVDSLHSALAELDHLIVCLPGDHGTHHLLDATALASMRPDATVVNVGRGSVIDTHALCAALRRGQLRGAFLDVHEVEPVGPDDALRQVPGLVISPHCAFRFPGEPDEVATCFLDNLADLRARRSPRDLIAWPDRPQE